MKDPYSDYFCYVNTTTNRWATWGRALLYLGSPVEARDENRKEMCSLTESLSTVGLQSLLAECLYLKGLPEESSHLAWNTDGSHITAAGGFWVLCSIKKQAAWIGLSWQLGWVSVWSGRKRNTEEKRKIERELVCLYNYRPHECKMLLH